MKLFFLISISLFSSCSQLTPDSNVKEGKTLYSFTDISGRYSFSREIKLIKKRLVTRVQLNELISNKILEKSITVSQIGTIKDKKARVLTVRPMASEFTVWLEGKKYSSKMQINSKGKSMLVRMDSPEPEWKGTKEVKFPTGKYFCFYSQIPDCLYQNQLLQRSHKNPNTRTEFYIVWDSFPYIQEQFTGIRKNLFTRASLKFEGEVQNSLRFMVELEGQVILYHFSKSFDFVKMAWIAQGITIVPFGEEMPHEEQ